MAAVPCVSVVIPCYNYGRYLRACLESVLMVQTPIELEVLLIDDASTDETPAVAGAFADPRLRYIRHPRNAGHIASVNEGLRLARGCYLARLDADDCYAPGHLVRAVAVLDRKPRVGMVHGYCIMVSETGERLNSPSARAPGTRNELADLLYENHVYPPSAVVRRTAWEGIGLGYDPQMPYAEDWWVWLQLAVRGWEFHYLAETAAYFRLHGDSLRGQLQAADRSAPSEIYILDRLFALPGLPEKIVAQRKAIYAHRLRKHADWHYAAGRMVQCRRDLWAAARLRPRTMIEPRFWWRWAASWRRVGR